MSCVPCRPQSPARAPWPPLPEGTQEWDPQGSNVPNLTPHSCEPARPALRWVTFRLPILGSLSGSALRPNRFQQGSSSPGLFPPCRRRMLDSQCCSMPALEAFGEAQILLFVGLNISSPNYHIPVLPSPSCKINQKCPRTFPKPLIWQLLVGNI